ncbi:Ubiquinone/menaquinone biosynthesis methyltransferase family protein [hydrothermal vent metagenome]|uniref:Ubiquinone/menaquinone biosynthesis methyltransferase family protein n=1 Tax=hydrothermal vent metagenome TaxID=652676 RepID=A0A3B1BH92_9ZZZZ
MKPQNKEYVAPHPILSEYYGDESERRGRVDKMFDSSAKHYDWITNIMSFGSGDWYRRRALERSGLKPDMRILDVGSGTGVVAYLAQSIIQDQGLVVALDPSMGMLSEARTLGVRNITQGLGEKLPFPDDTFDRVTMGYALRHVADLHSLFAEYRRVLKPGGEILLLEITRPESALPRALLKFYMKGVVPTLTRLFRQSREAQELMRYYWDTIEQCVSPSTIMATMEKAGLNQSQRHVMLGIFSEYSSIKAKTNR